MKVKSLSRVRLLATPWTAARQAPLSMGLPRQDYWSGLPRSPPGDLTDSGIEPVSLVSCIGRQVLTTSATWEVPYILLIYTILSLYVYICMYAAAAAAAKSLQSCPTLCDPKDGSPPGSPVPGILLARVLERGAIAFCKTRFSKYILQNPYIHVCLDSDTLSRPDHNVLNFISNFYRGVRILYP